MSKNPQQPNPHFRGERGAPGDPVPASEAIQPDQPEKKPSKLKKAVPWAVAGILGLIIGGAIGSSNADDQPSEDTVSSEVQESGQAPEPEEVEIEVASEDCIVALTHSDNLIEIYSAALTTAGEGIEAYAYDDYEAVEEATSEIEAMSGELTQTLTDYYISSDECRAAR